MRALFKPRSRVLDKVFSLGYSSVTSNLLAVLFPVRILTRGNDSFDGPTSSYTCEGGNILAVE